MDFGTVFALATFGTIAASMIACWRLQPHPEPDPEPVPARTDETR